MRNQTLTTHDNEHSEEVFCLPVRWYESDFHILSMVDPDNSIKELELLHQEAREYDFLTGKTPNVLPVFWEEEE